MLVGRTSGRHEHARSLLEDHLCRHWKTIRHRLKGSEVRIYRLHMLRVLREGGRANAGRLLPAELRPAGQHGIAARTQLPLLMGSNADWVAFPWEKRRRGKKQVESLLLLLARTAAANATFAGAHRGMLCCCAPAKPETRDLRSQNAAR